MNTIFIILAKYLIYLIIAWTLVSGWYLGRGRTKRQLFFWLVQIGIAMAIVYLGVKILNDLFPELRPFVAGSFTPLIEHANDPSFPSSHTAAGAVFATFMWKLRRDWGIVAFILTGLVGLSRVMVGVHYPIDILGGAILGAASALVVIKFWPRKLA